jgi:hypothetical protein
MTLPRNISGKVKPQRVPIRSPEYGLYKRAFHHDNSYGMDIDMVDGKYKEICYFLEIKNIGERLSDYEYNTLTNLSEISGLPSFAVGIKSALSPAKQALLKEFNDRWLELDALEGGPAPIQEFSVRPLGDIAKGYIDGPTAMTDEEYLKFLDMVKSCS